MESTGVSFVGSYEVPTSSYAEAKLPMKVFCLFQTKWQFNRNLKPVTLIHTLVICLTITVLKCFLNMQLGEAIISAFGKSMFKKVRTGNILPTVCHHWQTVFQFSILNRPKSNINTWF